MYVTKRLSELLRSADEALTAPPEGPNSGYLVIQDGESETYSCFGLCKNRRLDGPPFPQDKELTFQYITSTFENTQTHLIPVFLIPVLNHPLSSNRYYSIVPHGNRIGEAFTCLSEQDQVSFCCFCHCVTEVKSRPLDPCNVYQQIEIVPYEVCEGLCSMECSFYARAIASDGLAPYFFRRKGWTIHTKSAKNFKLGIADGVDSRLRAQLPEFDDSLPQNRSKSLIVGKWYCPFVFVKEGSLRHQVKKSMYYEITLEQIWEQIFACNRNSNKGNSVAIKAGLREEVVERMKWEQERIGYLIGEERQVKIDRVEKCNGFEEWSEFGCYVLVERFNLRRMDGSLVMCYDFKQSDKMKTKWQ